MNPQRCIVFSLDGLVATSLGCFGSSWNRTPAIDRLAADGTLWDRVVVRDFDPRRQLQAWFSGDDSKADWSTAWRRRGTVELFSDSPAVSAAPWIDAFDVNHAFTPDPATVDRPVDAPATDLQDCVLTHLVATVLDRMKQDQDWGLLWLHSDSLLTRWDAPRDMFSLEDVWDDDVGNEEPIEDLGGMSPEIAAGLEFAAEAVPPFFDSLDPPRIRLTDADDPDLLTSWMRTYGAQVQLVDTLIGVLHDTAQRCDAAMVLVGTRGFALGQQGRIGDCDGPPVAADLHIPLVVAPSDVIRCHQLASDQIVPEVIRKISQSDPCAPLVSPEQWSSDGASTDTAVVSHDRDRERCSVSTPEWFFSKDQDGSRRLFLKPDDANDFNDVSRLKLDVTEKLDALVSGSGRELD